jgi:formylglycine-generating enzyme required for sulfatase activity
MIRKAFFVGLAALLVLGIAACTKKEEPAAKQETAAPAAPAKEEPKPGEMVLIPAGEFIMGSNDDKLTSAYPEHKDNLPAFWIDKYEVTNAEFLKFSIDKSYAGEGAKEGKDWRQFVSAATYNNPVVFITWNDAKAYCEGQGKRLPTEEEWEKAARGPNGFRYPWGPKWEPGRSNVYETGARNPGPIGQYDDVSPYGVHDMLGNVQEWTGSWYKAYKGSVKGDPNFGERYRVVRGASSRLYGSRFGLWLRSAYVPNALYDFGCRCAKDATPEEAAKAAPAK